MKIKIKNPLAFWYKIAKGLAIVGSGFWLLETAYFIILEGWHWKPTNPAELWADYVVQSCFGGVFIALGMCLLELIEDRVKLDEEWEHLRHVTETAWEKAKLEDLKDKDLEPLAKVEIEEERECDKACGVNYCAIQDGCRRGRLMNRRKWANENSKSETE